MSRRTRHLHPGARTRRRRHLHIRRTNRHRLVGTRRGLPRARTRTQHKEQRMNTPIKREDIRKGDTIRVIRSIVTEFVAQADATAYPESGATYELVKRPVELPTKYGVYLPYFYADGEGIPNVWILNRHGWTELPNMPDRKTEALDIATVAAQLGTLVYLGTGSIEQQVSQ